MKIAIFYNLPFSGAKRTVLEQVKGLRSLGHSVDVYTMDADHDLFDPGRFANRRFYYNYKPIIVNVPFLKKVTSDLSDFFLLKNLHKKIAKEIDEKKYDVVLANTDKFTQAPFLLKFLKTKKVYICLEPLKIAYEYGLRIPDRYSIFNKIYESINRGIRKKIDRDNARSSDLPIAISNFGRELMIQAFDIYPKVLYMGVDTTIFKKQKIPKKNQILFIGQKIDMNGYRYAVRAINKIPKKIRPTLVVLSISKNAKKRLSDKGIVKLYSESIATLSLSNFDTFGLVPIESLACETPVIAFNVAAYRETVLDGITGFLVDFEVDQVSEKIELLSNNSKLANSMGRNGRKWVEDNWSWDMQIKNLEKHLTQVLEVNS